MAVQETVLYTATKDPKHVLQDESLFCYEIEKYLSKGNDEYRTI